MRNIPGGIFWFSSMVLVERADRQNPQSVAVLSPIFEGGGVTSEEKEAGELIHPNAV